MLTEENALANLKQLGIIYMNRLNSQALLDLEEIINELTLHITQPANTLKEVYSPNRLFVLLTTMRKACIQNKVIPIHEFITLFISKDLYPDASILKEMTKLPQEMYRTCTRINNEIINIFKNTYGLEKIKEVCNWCIKNNVHLGGLVEQSLVKTLITHLLRTELFPDDYLRILYTYGADQTNIFQKLIIAKKYNYDFDKSIYYNTSLHTFNYLLKNKQKLLSTKILNQLYHQYDEVFDRDKLYLLLKNFTLEQISTMTYESLKKHILTQYFHVNLEIEYKCSSVELLMNLLSLTPENIFTEQTEYPQYFIFDYEISMYKIPKFLEKLIHSLFSHAKRLTKINEPSHAQTYVALYLLILQYLSTNNIGNCTTCIKQLIYLVDLGNPIETVLQKLKLNSATYYSDRMLKTNELLYLLGYIDMQDVTMQTYNN